MKFEKKKTVCYTGKKLLYIFLMSSIPFKKLRRYQLLFGFLRKFEIRYLCFKLQKLIFFQALKRKHSLRFFSFFRF